jgi:hypothetical protein
LEGEFWSPLVTLQELDDKSTTFFQREVIEYEALMEDMELLHP